MRKPTGFPFAAAGGNWGIERGHSPSQVEADENGEGRSRRVAWSDHAQLAVFRLLRINILRMNRKLLTTATLFLCLPFVF